MNICLYWVNLATTFGVFSAVCWRLYHTARPEPSLECRSQWLIWGGVHIGIAYAMLIILFDTLGRDAGNTSVGLHIVLLKVCLMVLFLVRWRRRISDR